MKGAKNDPDTILTRYLIKKELCSMASQIGDEKTRTRRADTCWSFGIRNLNEGPKQVNGTDPKHKVARNS